jgi:DNA-binding SARP family transcriptional activator
MKSHTDLLASEPKASLRAQLLLLSGFELFLDDESLPVPLSTQRVLALLSLQEKPLQRVHVAGVLWPDMPEHRAAANLRSALWKLRSCGFGLVETRYGAIQLSPLVSVDVRDATALAQQTLQGEECEVDETRIQSLLMADVLPDWYEDWVTIERERFRQLRLHALEAAAETLAKLQEYARASRMALAAISSEPLRESAHRCLIRIHIAEGNQAEAVRQYWLFSDLLSDELGTAPSNQMEALVEPLQPRRLRNERDPRPKSAR